MSFSQFLSILQARRLMWWSILALTVVTTIIVSLILPRQYTAGATVVVDVKSPDPISGVVLQGMIAPGYMATQVDIIQSDRVAKKVLKDLRLDQSPELRSQWQDETDGEGAFDSWLAERIQKKLDVKPQRESNVIHIAYTGADPRFASAVANAFVKAYLDVSLELRVEPAKQYSTMFEDQTVQARTKLEEAQSKLSAYQQKSGLVATDERLDVENARLLELSSQLVALQTQSAESRSRQAQAGNNSPEVLNNGLILTLKSDLSRQEAKQKELLSKYGNSHPQVMELNDSIAEVRSKLESETRRITGSLGVNNTVNQSRESQVRAALEAQRTKILQIKAQRDEAAVLVRDVESAQRTYDAIQARLSQTSLESQSNSTNISILKIASPPSEASSPRILLNTLLSIFLGLMLASGIVLGVELNDRRLRSVEDVTGNLNLLLLGEMPKAAFKGDIASEPAVKRLTIPSVSALSAPHA